MKKLLTVVFVSAFFITFGASQASANLVAPSFTVDSATLSADQDTLTYTASGLSGFDQTNCGADQPFDVSGAGGYRGGFTIVTPYVMSGGTASASTASASIPSSQITKTDNGTVGMGCGDPARYVQTGPVNSGSMGNFTTTGSLSISSLPVGTYTLSVNLCASGTCRAATKSFTKTAACSISSFTADNPTPAYNTGTTLRFVLAGPASPSWSMSPATTPSSGSGSGSATTGNLTSPQTYTLTCGSATRTLTVTPGAPTTYSITTTVNPGSAGTATVTNQPVALGSRANVSVTRNPNYVINLSGVVSGCPNPDTNPPYGFSSTSTTSNTYVSGPINNSCNITFNFTNTASAVNGSCGTTPTHYSCSAGTSTSNVNGSTAWTWTCAGSGTGATDAMCSENKPDLTASAPGQTAAAIGTPQTFTSTILNSGSSTGTSFSNSLQVATGANGTGAVSPLTASTLSPMTTLAAGSSAQASASYTFTGSAGTRSVRFCADNNTSMSGTISEANENNNCSAWTNVTVSAASQPVNGVCATTHYNCSAGTSASNVSGASSWTWTCNGVNGGTAAFCTEGKYVDLTASVPPPATVPVGVPQSFSSTITNGGNTSTGATFANLFQTSPSSTGASGVVDYPVSPNMSSLGPGSTAVSTSPSITFASSGTMYVRACADKNSAASTGTISEVSPGSENNNCSAPWTVVTVSSSMSGTLTPAVNSCTIASGASNCSINFSWNTVNPVATSSVTKPTNVTVGSGNTGTSVPFTVKYSSETFYLYNNSILLDQKTVSSSCISGTSWNGSTCAPVGGGGGGGGGNPGSCANGATNYPTCTINSSGACLNGATNPPMCTMGGSGGSVVNGSCSTAHYGCSSGTSTSNVSGVSAWTWTCSGSGGGTSASCSELKKKPVFIED